MIRRDPHHCLGHRVSLTAELAHDAIATFWHQLFDALHGANGVDLSIGEGNGLRAAARGLKRFDQRFTTDS